MMENIIAGSEWLENSVPLWAFLVALLTSPSEWAGYVKDAIDVRMGDVTEEDD